MCIIKIKFMRSFLEVIHIAVVILINYLSGCSLAVLMLRSSSSQTVLGLSPMYCFSQICSQGTLCPAPGAFGSDIGGLHSRRCCGLFVQEYNITFDCSFLNRLFAEGRLRGVIFRCGCCVWRLWVYIQRHEVVGIAI